MKTPLTLILIATLVAGCGQERTEGQSDAPAPSETPRSGGRITVAVASEPLRHRISGWLAERGYDVLSFLGAPAPGAASLPPGISFHQRLGRFAALDLMVTDRFHGSLFTFKIGGAPVIFVEDTGNWPLPNSKGRDLFGRLGVGDMVWRCGPGDAEQYDFLAHLDRAEAWRDAATDLPARFEALRASAAGALGDLRDLLRGGVGG